MLDTAGTSDRDGPLPPARTVSFDVGPLTRIPPGEGRLVTLGRLTVAVFRTRAGEVFATDPWCPHQMGPLADGMVANGRVVCPLHAYRFSLATGEAEGHSCGALSTYEVRLRPDGHVALHVPAECAE
jgi:nitrite reductase [NAD(P)H] small subunit